MARRCWVWAFLILGCLTIPAQGQAPLGWKLKEGDKFYVETVTKLKQTMKVSGNEVKQDIDLTDVKAWTVLKKNADNSMVLEQTVEVLKLKVGGSIPQPDEKLIEKLQGVSLKLNLDPKGEVTSVEGLDEMAKKLFPDDEKARKMMQDMLGEDRMKMAVAELFGFLPDKPAAKGDKWERKSTMALGPLGTLTLVRQFMDDGPDKLDGKAVEKIGFEETIALATPAKPAAGGLPLEVQKMDFKSENSKGTIWFDATAGRLVQFDRTLKIKGNLTLTVMGMKVEGELVQEGTVQAHVSTKKPEPK